MKSRKPESDGDLGKVIGRRMRSAFEALGLTITQASEYLGYPQSTISRYLAGQNLPQLDLLISLYERLKVNPLYILFGIEPMFIESLPEKPKGDPSLTPFVQRFLNHIKDNLKMNDFQLYAHSKLKLTFSEFRELLSGNFIVDMEIFHILSCSFCADIDAIWEDTVYRPNIIQVSVFDWDRKLEENKAFCPAERYIIVIDITGKDLFYIWCKHGDYGGFIIKVLYSYDDLDGLFWLLSRNLRAYISIDFNKDFEKQHPHVTLTSQENYFYGNLMQGLGYLKDISSDHPAIRVLQRFIFLLQENL